ncbi:YmiA family putative membrane protein [Kalamiella sp. sgz302252]|uniref:YmiA family putative membrane protein n=1 Tax=Pantoea sp. sgz302252 TaxID=3341827 RepID=UPI0036D3A308
MASRLTVETDFGHKALKVQRNGNLRRKAWLAVFAGSALFWGAVAVVIWHIWG